MAGRKFKIFRTEDNGKGEFVEYETDVQEGMVVLDAVHQIQEESAPDLALRWNCKAGKCGSCSAEVNGVPKLMCMTRLNTLPEGVPVHIAPLQAFSTIRDLVTDISWNYEQNKRITPFTANGETEWEMLQHEVEPVQEFRKCIECFLCQDACHVLRTHAKHDDFIGPRFMIRTHSLDMHPLDRVDRAHFLKTEGGAECCNITKCCTEVCPEEIRITDNAIIPIKERIAAEYYDPLKTLFRRMVRKKGGQENE